jgi:hypothetical protein
LFRVNEHPLDPQKSCEGVIIVFKSKFALFVLILAGACASIFSPGHYAWSAQPNRLVFTTEPSNGNAGQTLAPITVSVEDTQGNVQTSDNTTQIRLTLSVFTATLSGTKTQTVVNGVATFSDLSIDKPGTGYTLLAASVNVGPPPLASALSTPFNISAGGPAQLGFVQQPTDVLAGEFVSPAVSVAVQDLGSNTVTTDNGTLITVAITLCSTPITLSATTDSSGIATFPTLRLNTIATGDILNATATGLAGATSAAFNVLVNPDRIFWDGFDDPLCTP